MTLNEIQVAVYRRLNYEDAAQSTVVARILQWINIWNQRILAKPGMDNLRETTFTFTSVVNQTTYALPDAITRIENVFEQTTPRTLRMGTQSWIREYDPQLRSVGVPELYALISSAQTMAQPTAATGVWAVSTSAADTLGPVFHVEGIRTGGYRSGDQLTILNGLTRVPIGASPFTDYIEIDKAYVAPASAAVLPGPNGQPVSGLPQGVVSLFDAAVAGNELARIQIGQTSQRVQVIQLWPTPQTAILYSVDCKRVAEYLINATDVSTLPPEFHWLLVEAASYEEWMRKDDSRAKVALSDLNEGIRDLRNWVTNLPDYKPKSGERFDRPSRLGGFYPSW